MTELRYGDFVVVRDWGSVVVRKVIRATEKTFTYLDQGDEKRVGKSKVVFVGDEDTAARLAVQLTSSQGLYNQDANNARTRKIIRDTDCIKAAEAKSLKMAVLSGARIGKG